MAQYTDTKDHYLTISDLAALLCIKEKTIRQWIYLGKIPSLKINGLVRFSRRAIDDWVTASARGRQGCGPVLQDPLRLFENRVGNRRGTSVSSQQPGKTGREVTHVRT